MYAIRSYYAFPFQPVEELVKSGINDITIITGRNKYSLEDHFDYSYELEHTLELKGKTDMLKIVKEISEMANIYFIRQKEPLGLGHRITSYNVCYTKLLRLFSA